MANRKKSKLGNIDELCDPIGSQSVFIGSQGSQVYSTYMNDYTKRMETGDIMNSYSMNESFESRWDKIQRQAKERIEAERKVEETRRTILSEKFTKAATTEVDAELLADFRRIAEADRMQRASKKPAAPPRPSYNSRPTLGGGRIVVEGKSGTKPITETISTKVVSTISKLSGVTSLFKKVPGVSVITGAVDELKTIVTSAKEEYKQAKAPQEPIVSEPVTETQTVNESTNQPT